MTLTTTVTICQEIEEVILHPAEYVQEKVRRQGISCLFLPHCCTPTWVMFPECYILQWVKKRDAWQEIKRTYTCQDFELTVEDAFKAWLRNAFDPVPGFRIQTGALTELFGAYIGAAYEVAKPIPDEYLAELRSMADQPNFVFSRQNVNQARWLRSDHPLAQRIWPGGDVQGITYYNLVIVSDSFFNQTHCGNLSYWAHELVHVHQYNEMGWENFLEEYLSQGIVHKWENITLETEALYVEGLALGDCTVRFQPLTPIEQAFDAKWRNMMSIIRQMQSEGEIEIARGRISRMSERARAALRRAVPQVVQSQEATIQQKGQQPARAEKSELKDMTRNMGERGEE